jgi:hypothetical protein
MKKSGIVAYIPANQAALNKPPTSPGWGFYFPES